MFFFEKKNQKTFSRCVWHRCALGAQCQPHEQKFFASFFQKRSSSFVFSGI